MYVVSEICDYNPVVDMDDSAMDVDLMIYIAYLYMVPAIDCTVEHVEAYYGKVVGVNVADFKIDTDSVSENLQLDVVL